MSMRYLLVLCCVLLAGCQQELLKALDQRQANEVLGVLQQANIAADKKDAGKQGYTVLVDERDFSAAVDLLKARDLPSKARVEITQLFPTDALVNSPRAEKARLYSAIEQRLEQSLVTLPDVVTARLHVSYDVEGAEGRKQATPVHLSTLVVYQNEVDEAVLINEIKRFLKNSFQTVDYDNISVVLAKKAPTQHAGPQGLPANGMASPWFLGPLTLMLLGVLVTGGVLWRKGLLRWPTRRGQAAEAQP